MPEIPYPPILDKNEMDGIIWREAPLVLLRLDPANIVTSCNPYAKQLTGMDLKGMGLDQIFLDFAPNPAPIDVQALMAAKCITRFLLPTATGLSDNLLFRFLAGSPGEVLAVGWHDMPQVTNFQHQLIELNNELNYVVRAALKDSQFEIERQTAKHLCILESAGEGIFSFDADGRPIFVNPAAAAALGYSPEELIGKPSYEAWYGRHPTGQPQAAAESPIQQTLTHGISHTAAEDYFQRKDGEFVPVAFTSTPIIDHRKVVGAVVIFRDISERKQVEKTILRISTAVEQSPVSIVITDNTGAIEYVNPKFTEISGYSATEVQGQNLRFLKSGDTPPEVYKELWETITAGEVWRGEFHNKKKNGELFWERASISPIRDAHGIVTNFVAVKEDITARKRNEEALRESETKFNLIAENTSDGFLILGPDHRIQYVSPAYCRQLGFDEIEEINRDFESIHSTIHPDDRNDLFANIFEAIALKKDNLLYSYRAIHKTGNIIWREDNAKFKYDNSGKYCGSYVVCRDVTERQTAEVQRQLLQAQLQQSQKMESLGTLASGVAHDMNNVLGAILGLASAHIGTQPFGSPIHQALDTICKATERGGKMVKSLLSFARQSPAESHELDLNAILQEQVSLLKCTTLAKVRLEMDLASDLRPVLGDASALTHAFMNLCVNAVDAMPENGTLTLHTRNFDNDWIEVVVEDNGMGMPQEVLEKAIDPFFTTKETGKGTGLGLSMVFSTVKAHKGLLAIQSEPGQGTLVMLRFPACEKKAQDQIEQPAISQAALTPHGTLKVLLVDDDELIQSSIQMILEVLGHHVYPAQSGEEALAKLEAGFEPDLVILDMNMPGLGGAGTLPRLRGLRPEVPVLLSTGRTDQTALTLASAHPGVTLLSKPFGLRELQKHLENLRLG